MVDAAELLLAVAAVGEENTEERLQDARPPFPDAAFWGNEQSVQQLWASTDADIRCVGRGVRELLLHNTGNMELATMYFHMLASKDAPVRTLPT